MIEEQAYEQGVYLGMMFYNLVLPLLYILVPMAIMKYFVLKR